MQVLTLVFWKRIWAWCKINWKFLIGFAIPCAIFYFLNQKKAQKILAAGIEFRKKQIDVVQRAAELESAGIKKNAVEFADRVEEVNTKHEEALHKLDRESQAQRSELGGTGATNLTGALAERFDLNNGDKE